MRQLLKIWLGTAAAIAIYLVTCSVLDARQAYYENCSVVRCT
jgi:hypothetical protein